MSINKRIQDFLMENYSFIRQDVFQTKPKGAPPMAPRLVCDGIVDEDKYTDVIFLLKESTEAGIHGLSPEERETDLLKINEFPDDLMAWDFISTTKSRADAQGAFPKNWKLLCCWTAAMKDLQLSYEDALISSGERLLEIALINVKKTTGEGSSENAPLDPIAENSEYAALLRQQFEFVRAHSQKTKTVVCCGTFSLAKKIFAPTNVETLSTGKQFFVINNCVFLQGDHPSRRYVAHKKLYNDFKESFSALRKRTDV